MENRTSEAARVKEGMTLRVSLVVYMVLLALVITPSARADEETIKIGLLNPITGPIDVYAPGFEDAAEVAIAELNEIYDSDYNFELTVSDSGCDGTTASTGAQTLVDAGVIGIAGAACSGATLGAIDVASDAGMVMVSYASTSPAITDYDDDGYLFRVVPSDAQQGQALAAVAEEEGFSYPAILYTSNDYGAGLAAAFINEWYYVMDNDYCFELEYYQDQTDFSDEVEYIDDYNCDSVVMVTYATDGAAIIEEMAAQGINVPILGADGIGDLAFAYEFDDESLVDGVIATRPASGDSSEESQAFDEAYEEADGADGIYLREVYDAVMIIGHAAASDDGDGDLRDELYEIGYEYQGASSVHTFMSTGDVVGNGYLICEFSYDGDVDFTCDRSWKLGGVEPHDRTPTVAIYSDDLDIERGENLTIMAYAEDDGNITYCLWMSNISGNVGNSCSELSTGDLTEGMHWITFSAMDDAAQWSDSDSIFVTVVNSPPVVGIESISSYEIMVGEVLTLVGNATEPTSIETIATYEWSMENNTIGNASTLQTSELPAAVHTIMFRAANNHDVWSDYTSVTITVMSGPQAVVGEDLEIEPGGAVQFNGACVDIDGECVLYEWDFNGDDVFEYASGEDGRTINIYNNEGVFEATLRVTDDHGLTSSSNRTITVHKNIVPIAQAGINHVVLVGETIQLNGTCSDSDGTCEYYEWDVDGDGQYDYQSTTGGSTTYVLNEAGIYNAVFRVTDDDGLTSTDSVTIIVNPIPSEEIDDGGLLPAPSITASIAAVAIIALRRRPE